jgi:RNA-splicing ligase RtcB
MNKTRGQSLLRLIKRCTGFLPKSDCRKIKRGIRGIYVLFEEVSKRGKEYYDVMYIGMARKSMNRRLITHAESKSKKSLWTHFSVYEVWDNIRDDEIQELEGILRHIYRKDTQANAINKQRGFKPLRKLTDNKVSRWV